MGIETLPSGWPGHRGKGLMPGRQGKLGEPALGRQCPVSSTGAGSWESLGRSLPSLRLRVSSCLSPLCLLPTRCVLSLFSQCVLPPSNFFLLSSLASTWIRLLLAVSARQALLPNADTGILVGESPFSAGHIMADDWLRMSALGLMLASDPLRGFL